MKHVLLSGLLATFVAGFNLLGAGTALAQHEHHDHHDHNRGHDPIGLMGTHMHPKGEWMLSYRYMHMDMHGNRDGTSSIDPVTIATTVPNRFFGTAGQPPTLRVVPTDMTMDMHMIGAMFGATDWLTLMLMGSWQEKEMDHVTFQGGAGTTVLGTFTTRSKGIGDTKLGALVRLHEDHKHHVHLNVGASVPTGSIDDTARVLAPNGAQPRLRMPYAMQIGTGTFDALPGLTYTGRSGKWGWGTQYMGEIRLESENWEGYAHGDKHTLSAWGRYQWYDWLGSSLRLTATKQSAIDGIDPNIVAPVQTADPDNYGGKIIDVAGGFAVTPDKGYLQGHSFEAELSVPLHRDLNGPQMETDWALTAGWRLTF